MREPACDRRSRARGGTSACGTGTTPPQVDVEVRLNTNESPYPPPAAWLEALRRVPAPHGAQPLPRPGRVGAAPGPGRPARGARPSRCSAPTAPTRCCRSLCLAYGGAGPAGGHLRADLRPARHIAHLTGTEVVEGERGADFAIDLDAMGEASGPGPARDHLPLLAQQPDRDGRGRRRWSPPCSEQAPGLVVVDEAYGQFADWSALSLVDDDRPLVVTRTYSKTWSMAGRPPRLPDRAGRGRRGPRAGRPALPPRRLQAGGRDRWPCASRRPWRQRVADLVARTRAAGRRPGRPAGDHLAVAGQLHPLAPRRPHRPPRSGRAWSSVRCWCATAAAGPAWPAASGSRWAPRRTTTAFSPPSRRCSAVTDRPAREVTRPGRPRRRRSRSRSASTARAGSTCAPGCPSSITWCRSSASTPGST